jgi:hypothetical protein
MHSMTTLSRAVLAALLLAACTTMAEAQSNADVPINAQTALFCRDNTGEPVLQKYSDLGGVMRRYAERFHFDMSVQPGKPLKVVFSKPDETPYSITYSVEPYRDDAGRSGILLDSMHIYLDNADRDVAGPPMCYFTEFGK